MSGILIPILGNLAHKTITSLSQIPNLDAAYISDPANATNYGLNIPADGGGVKTWLDTAAALHDANQAVSNRQPTWRANQQNGRGVVRFDGSNDLLSVNPSAFLQSKTGATMFVIAKSLTLSGTPCITTSDQNGYRIDWGTTYKVGMAGGRATSTVTGDTTGFHLFTLRFNGAYTNASDITDQNNGRLQFRYDGVPQTLTFTSNVNAATASTGSYIYFGCDADGSSNFWNGEMGRVAYFTRALSNVEIDLVEDFLASSTQWNLPI